MVAEADGSEALGRAAQLVRVATGQSLSPALLRRAGESPEAIGADRREHDLVARIYGTHSPEAALASPDRSRHAVASVRVRERIAQLFQPSRMRLVVVGPLERGALERALTEATQGIAPTPHAAPRTLEPRTWAPPRPQVRVYGGDLSLGAISALAPGPPVGAADHAAFRVAVRILGGMYSSRPNQVFREERRESYGAHAVVLDNGTHSLVRFETTIETPQINAVLDVVFDELGRLGDAAALSDEEIERARRLEIAAETLRWDDGGSLASSILDARVRGERPSPERALESLRAVDRAAIAEASRRWLAPDRLAIVATGRSTWMFSHPPAAPGGYAFAE